jgi:lycopene cyclase domain-containing protein
VSYTSLAVIGVVAALVLDRWVARTRVTSTRDWWSAYAIIVFFQLLTNGWLTGRGIVRYADDAIIGTEQSTLLGDGRLVYAPVEDLAFGFALVLTSVVVWVWLGRRRVDTAEGDR